MDIKNKRTKLFLDYLKDKKPGRILDIGCQGGYISHKVTQYGYEAYGIDVVKGLIVEAQRKYPQGNFICADCEKEIPFESNYFDIIWAGDIIEHIHFTDTFINEINRVLKVGGVFVLSTPMHNRLKNVLISLCCFEKHFDPEFPHLRFYTLKSLRNVLEKRGLYIENVFYLGRIKLLACSMFVISRKREDKIVISKHQY